MKTNLNIQIKTVIIQADRRSGKTDKKSKCKRGHVNVNEKI